MLLKERYDKEREAQMVYRTTDAEHPGVAALYRQGEVLLRGPGGFTGSKASDTLISHIDLY